MRPCRHKVGNQSGLSRQLATSRDTPETQANSYLKPRVYRREPRRGQRLLNECKGEQARAEQREPCRGQDQQAAGDKIMIVHEAPLSTAQGER